MNHSPISSWDEIHLGHLAMAYRKAKVDCFFEKAVPQALQFAEYECDLSANLQRLLVKLHSSKRDKLLSTAADFGEPYLIPKKLSLGKILDRQGQAYYSDPARAFRALPLSDERTAEYRLSSRLSVDFHIVSALWVNVVGHRLDAELAPQVYGSRLRRYKDTVDSNRRKYNHEALGSMPAYFYPYQQWREDGMKAMERLLKHGHRVCATTLDLRNYFHNIDPQFILDRTFWDDLRAPERSSANPDGLAETGITGFALELTQLLVHLLHRWELHMQEHVVECGENLSSVANAPQRLGLPINLTASRVLSNVLLARWDRVVLKHLAPEFYGRYVDDMFLVLKDSEAFEDRESFFQWMATRLPPEVLVRPPFSSGEWEIHLGLYSRTSNLTLHGQKGKIFFLEPNGGMDLLHVIRREITDISSERRLLPDPDMLTDSPAARALSATDRLDEAADSVGDSDGLSLRRLGWAIQLRNAETLALDLPRNEWTQIRREFYRFANAHVLRTERILEHIDTFPRLFGLAISCRDWNAALKLYDLTTSNLTILLDSCSAVRINGSHKLGVTSTVRNMAVRSLEHLATEALLKAWPWRTKKRDVDPMRTASRSAKLLLKRFGIESYEHEMKIRRLTESDLGRASLIEHRRNFGLNVFALGESDDLEPVLPVFAGRDETIRRFLKRTAVHRLRGEQSRKYKPDSERLHPYLFPTRPFSARELAEYDPYCVGIGAEPISPSKARRRWRRLVVAFRSVWIPPTPTDVVRNLPARYTPDRPQILEIGASDHNQDPIICITSLETSDNSWIAAATGHPETTLARYRQISRLVNEVLRLRPTPHYVLFPELSIPHRWVRSVTTRLLNARISVIAGVEYYSLGGSEVENKAILAMTDNRLGYPSQIAVWHTKLSPAPHEEHELLNLAGRGFPSPDTEPMPARVYRHGSFAFGMAICSELQDIGLRTALRGQIDALFTLSWNPDIETFGDISKASALDLHAYVAIANNRRYGDSHVRCPAKERYRRELCRLHGGLNDHAISVKLDVSALRAFQSRARNWPTSDDPFKPVPSGFRIARFRRVLPQ